ncbi:KTSC domain-containing protein [Jiangella gansuensis]|uniref:KTSC domain-containing protein n=1 Tax=Jiangella gansuensis TaxID=281473 RepID=UPI001B7FAD84|nr:KTSC domain-containing protein [Jiangella gansuensis]
MDDIRRWPVSSSALRSVGYEPRSRTLEVEFASGQIYRYFDVDQLDVDALLVADSMGAYVNEEIKPHHDYVHVTAPDSHDSP